MIVQSEFYKDLEPSHKTAEMLGIEIIQVSKSGERLDIIFHKGIALSLTQKVITLHMDKIYNKNQRKFNCYNRRFWHIYSFFHFKLR